MPPAAAAAAEVDGANGGDVAAAQPAVHQRSEKKCRFPYVDQYKRVWPLDVDSLRPGDFIYPNDVVDDIYRPISRKPIMWLAWREEGFAGAKRELVETGDHKTTFWLDIVRVEDKKYRKDIMLPTSQMPFQIGAFGGGDGTQNLQVIAVNASSGCRTTQMAQYVYQWKIPRGIVHEYTYRFRLRVEGKTDLLVQSADFFLNATQRERVVANGGGGGEVRRSGVGLAPYWQHASQVGRSLPLARRMGLAAQPWRQSEGLLLLGIFALMALLVASFVKDTRKPATAAATSSSRSKQKFAASGLPTTMSRSEKT